MNILWISDGKKGHEKQVEILLNEVSKTENIIIKKEIVEINKFSKLLELATYSASLLLGSLFLNTGKFLKYDEDNIDIIIGAGSSIHMRMLLIKNYLSNKGNSTKVVSILTPSFYRRKFDIICSPLHDSDKLSVAKKNVIFFEGCLAKVSTNEVEENIGFIGIGGTNKHFAFDQDAIIMQIEFLIGLYQQKKWFLFISRRTPNEMVDKINKIALTNKNLIISDDNYDEIIEKASIKVVTQDSINMIYESLSTKGQTLLFNMKYIKINKIVNQIDILLSNKRVGYVENVQMVDGLDKIKIISQNMHNDVFAEVEKVAYKLIQELRSKSI
jgi:mitochondrial fission protein ELM1